jgi:hypothetical protein
MKEFEKYLNDIEMVERVFLKCYGSKYGKTSLIQSKSDALATNDQSFLLTNDGSTILSCMSFSDNQLLVLIVKLVQSHSLKFGDGCKTLFIYVASLMKHLQADEDKLKQAIRLVDVYEVIEQFMKEFIHFNEHKLLSIQKNQSFFSYFGNLSVLSDLNGFNKNLSILTKEFSQKLVENYLSNVNSTDSVRIKLRKLLDDLDFISVYSNKASITSSKLFNSGFLLESGRISLNCLKNLKKNNINGIRAILLFISPETNQSINAEARITIRSNLVESVNQAFYAEKITRFSISFIQQLNQNDINLVITNGSLTELQKSKLILNNISFIEYADYNMLNHICFTQLNLIPLYISENDDETRLDASKNILFLDEIVNVELNQINFFKINKDYHKASHFLTCIYFCSPTKILFNHFKNNLIKSVKSFMGAFTHNESTDLNECIIETGTFEREASKICESIEKKLLSQINDDLRKHDHYLIFKALKKLFSNLDRKMSRSDRLDSQFESLMLNSKSNSSQKEYDFFYLKLESFRQTLYFVQKILNIDQIVYYNRKKTSTKIQNDRLITINSNYLTTNKGLLDSSDDDDD